MSAPAGTAGEAVAETPSASICQSGNFSLNLWCTGTKTVAPGKSETVSIEVVNGAQTTGEYFFVTCDPGVQTIATCQVLDPAADVTAPGARKTVRIQVTARKGALGTGTIAVQFSAAGGSTLLAEITVDVPETRTAEFRIPSEPFRPSEGGWAEFTFNLRNTGNVLTQYVPTIQWSGGIVTCGPVLTSVDLPKPALDTDGQWLPVVYNCDIRKPAQNGTVYPKATTSGNPGFEATISGGVPVHPLSYTVTITPEMDSIGVTPNTTGRARFTVAFAGTATTATEYQLHATCTGGAAARSPCYPSQSRLNLGPGSSIIVEVPYTTTDGYTAGSTGEITLHATAVPPRVYATANAALRLGVVRHDVAVTVSPQSVSVAPNGPVNLEFTVKNNGTETVTYTLTRSCSTPATTGCGALLPPLTVQRGTSEVVVMSLTAGSQLNASGPVSLTAKYGNFQHNASATVTVSAPYGVTVSGPSSVPALTPGASAQATFTVTNRGPADAYTIEVECDTPPLASCTRQPTTLDLKAYGTPGDRAQVTVGYTAGTIGGSASLVLWAYGTPGQAVGSWSFDVNVNAFASVAVTTPERTADTVATGARDSVSFLVKNTGTDPTTYAMTLGTCSGALLPVCGPPKLASVPLGGGDTARIWIPVTAGQAEGGPITVTLTASTARAWAPGAIPSASLSLYVREPLVRVAESNPGTTQERSHCLTIPVSTDVASECGDLTISHRLPGVTTRGVYRAPTFVYNSQHARPHPLVAADIALPAGDAGTGPVSISLTLAGETSARAVRTAQRSAWAGKSGTAADAWRRVVLGFAASDLSTGVYPYTLRVDYGSGRVESVPGELVIVNRAGIAAGRPAHEAPFGAGWWLAGYEQVYPMSSADMVSLGQAARVLWVGGDGSTRVYVYSHTESTGNRVYQAEKLTRQDYLVMLRSTDGHLYISRMLPNNARVQFDSVGRQLMAVDQLNQHTWFIHEKVGERSRLSYIQVPPSTSSHAFILNYDAITGLVTGIRSPGLTPTTPRVTTLQIGAVDGKLKTFTDPDGATAVFDYGSPDGRMQWYKPRGGAIHYLYFDGGGKLRSVGRWARLPATNGSSDPGQLVADHFCAAETRTLESNTHCSGAPEDPRETHSWHDGPRDDVADITRYWLDRFGGVTKVVNALSNSATVTPDSAFPGLPRRVRDFGGLETEYVYSARGLPDTVRVVNPLGDGRDAVTAYTYDPGCVDQVRTVRPPSGVVTRFTYVPSKCVVETTQVGSDPMQKVTYTYHVGGGLDGLIHEVSVPTVPNPTVYGYDPVGNPAVVASPTGAETRYFQDVLGRDTLVRVPANAAGSVIRSLGTAYDVMDRPIRARDGVPDDTLFVASRYDAAGALIAVSRWKGTLADSATALTLTDETVLDGVGRPTRQVDNFRPGAVPTMTYDPAGNLRGATNREGKAVTATYDALGRPLVQNADGLTTPTTYRYDPAGRWMTAENVEGRDSLTYGPAGQLLSHAVFRGASNAVEARLRWAYDSAGRVRERSVIAGSDSSTVQYRYDDRGRLDRIVDPSGRATAVEYAPDGDLDVVRLGNGVTVDYRIPWTGTPATIGYLGPNGLPLSLGAHYGYTSRLGQLEAQVSPDMSARRSFAFDLRGRVTQAADSTSGECRPYFTGRSLTETFPGEQPLGYDCEHGALARPPYVYQYDTFGDRAGIDYRRGHRVDLAVLPGSVHHQHIQDADGNTIRRYDNLNPSAFDQTMTWGAGGELVAVATTTLEGTQTVSYGYDAFGRRVRRTGPNGSVTYTLWDGDDIAATLDVSGQATAVYAYYPGVDRPHSVRAGAAGAPTYYFASDALGNVVGLTDDVGSVIARYAYGPFGESEVVPDSGTVANLLRFKGRELDPVTRLYDMRARWYDPQVGRFVSEDPIGLAGGINPYAFAGNDPVNFSDPSGLLSCETTYLQAIPWEEYEKNPEGHRASAAKACASPAVTSAPYNWAYALDQLKTWFSDRTPAMVNAIAGFGDGASFGLSYTARTIIGGNENVDFSSREYQVAAAVGAAAGLYLFWEGAELKIGNNFRIAPYGNRTGNPYGRFPHYHRRITDPAGNSVPGGGIGRHRPWEPPPSGTPWWRRF